LQVRQGQRVDVGTEPQALMQVNVGAADPGQTDDANTTPSRPKEALSMTHVASLRKITLHLARTKAFPDGSARHGYEFVVPLDESGHIVVESWRAQRNACVVHRFWGSEPRMRGTLVHRAGGTHGATWGFDYDSATNSDDEAGYRFGDHAFVAGEYVSLADADGELHTFRIVSVTAP
jgi:hypothetical protein